MSEAARKIMERYGWQKGQGLGKEKDGVTTYVKVVRRDPHTATGLGHLADPAVGGPTASTHAVELDAIYGQLKGSGGVKRKAAAVSDHSDSDDDNNIQKRARSSSSASSVASSASSSDSDDDGMSNSNNKGSTASKDITRMTDTELFARCGGVRLGRAGRHRFFAGKLARIEESHTSGSGKKNASSSSSSDSD